MTEAQNLENYGKSLVGKMAQSTLITEISSNGQGKVMSAPMKIIGYEMVQVCGEPRLMVIVDSWDGEESVYDDTLRNIH